MHCCAVSVRPGMASMASPRRLALIAACGFILLASPRVVAVPRPSGSAAAAPILQQFETVTVAASAPAQERFAAEQLSHWLSQILPVNVSVILTSAANASQVKVPHIVVGAGAAAPALPNSVIERLSGRPEAYACRSSWGAHNAQATAEGALATVSLTGGTAQPRGTLNAVFEFLHSVGFRFWNAAHPNRPALSTLPAPQATVPGCDHVFEPPIEYRLFNAHTVGAGDPLWRVQTHMSGAMDAEIPALPAEQGGGIGYVNGTTNCRTGADASFLSFLSPMWYSLACTYPNFCWATWSVSL
jgi:hypothetical protein